MRKPPDSKCWVCHGTGNRPWDDAWGSEAAMIEAEAPAVNNCYCVVGYDQLGNKWTHRSDEQEQHA